MRPAILSGNGTGCKATCSPTTRRLLYICPYPINKRLQKPGKRQYRPDCSTGVIAAMPTPRGVRSEDHCKLKDIHISCQKLRT
jgi:hypothetical protein